MGRYNHCLLALDGLDVLVSLEEELVYLEEELDDLDEELVDAHVLRKSFLEFLEEVVVVVVWHKIVLSGHSSFAPK